MPLSSWPFTCQRKFYLSTMLLLAIHMSNGLFYWTRWWFFRPQGTDSAVIVYISCGRKVPATLISGMSKRRFTFFFKKKSWKSRIQSQEDLPSFKDCRAVPIQADAAQNNIAELSLSAPISISGLKNVLPPAECCSFQDWEVGIDLGFACITFILIS